MTTASDGLTPKQEAFVLAYIKTGNATEAYRRAYDAEAMNDAAIGVEACRLLQHPKVSLRLQHLQARAANKAVLSRSWVLEQLMDNVTLAKVADDFTASNKALELLGKTDELQMFVERSSVTSDNRHHHTAEPVSAFAEFLAGTVGPRDQDPSAEIVPN